MLKRSLIVALLGVSPFFTSLHGYAQSQQAGAVAVVNINSADAKTLAQKLEGIGQTRAEEIVRYREAYGPFFAVEDLLEVRGVGKATLDNNRERIALE